MADLDRLRMLAIAGNVKARCNHRKRESVGQGVDRYGVTGGDVFWCRTCGAVSVSGEWLYCKRTWVARWGHLLRKRGQRG